MLLTHKTWCAATTREMLAVAQCLVVSRDPASHSSWRASVLLLVTQQHIRGGSDPAAQRYQRLGVLWSVVLRCVGVGGITTSWGWQWYGILNYAAAKHPAVSGWLLSWDWQYTGVLGSLVVSCFCLGGTPVSGGGQWHGIMTMLETRSVEVGLAVTRHLWVGSDIVCLGLVTSQHLSVWLLMPWHLIIGGGTCLCIWRHYILRSTVT